MSRPEPVCRVNIIAINGGETSYQFLSLADAEHFLSQAREEAYVADAKIIHGNP